MKDSPKPPTSPPVESSLDPDDWDRFRTLAHAVLDDAVDLLRTVRDRPVWRPVPLPVQAALREPLPMDPLDLGDVYRQFRERILPFPSGNIHPRFFGYVQGTGLAGGLLAELLAATLNSNCGGRDHAALYVERAVVGWCKTLFRFPETASGLLVSGTTLANLTALRVASGARVPQGAGTRSGPTGKWLVYTSEQAHNSIDKSLEMLGFRPDSLRKVPVDPLFRMDLRQLHRMVADDRRSGCKPFCVIGTAGTVNTGGIDDLASLAGFCADNDLWFHVDGAFGALLVLSENLRSRVEGIERADSLAFDFHKWMHVPYDAGCVLVRDGEAQRKTFSRPAPYLLRGKRGLSGGGEWPCDLGLEMSRGFRALKVWFAFKEHGCRRLGESVEQNCRQAAYLAGLINRTPELELLAEPTLNIVCFRFRGAAGGHPDLDRLNEAIVAELQESGLAAPSTTRVRGVAVVRVSLTNHRCRCEDLDLLVDAVVSVGRKLRGPAEFPEALDPGDASSAKGASNALPER
ncbi:MAG: aspartate aminotransferase family protein [Acidobacteria bacterium]|nr:aspartate aminotransferase family protein [Acidobacteriota bacterium]